MQSPTLSSVKSAGEPSVSGIFRSVFSQTGDIGPLHNQTIAESFLPMNREFPRILSTELLTKQTRPDVLSWRSKPSIMEFFD